MISVISTNTLRQAQERVPCRQSQLQQLAIYYNHHLPSPPVLVAYGLEHTGKLEAINAILQVSEINHAVVRVRECLSQRHLLTRIFAACVRQLDETANIERYDRIDSLNTLVINLQRLVEKKPGKFVLVVDGIDRRRGTSPTLLPALARLGDLVQGLSVILTSSKSHSIALHRSGVPFVHFAPYTRAQAISIVAKQTPSIPDSLPDSFPTIPEVQITNIYENYVTTIYDTLTVHTSSTSLPVFRRTCEKLWPRFIWPVLSGEQPPGRKTYTPSSNIKWDFARLLARNRSLFHSEGERALIGHLTSNSSEDWTFERLLAGHEAGSESTQTTTKDSESKHLTPLLKSFTTLLLIASYLASHTPPKHDIILFSRLSSSSNNKRKYLSSALSKSRTSGVRKTPTKKKAASLDATAETETPTKKRKSAGETGEGLAGEKTPKSTRLLLEKTSSIPRPFTLERVIAILRAIHPDGLPRTKGAADKVYNEMAELERLRLVIRPSGSSLAAEAGGVRGSGGGGSGGDAGILEEKWRINVGRDFVIAVGKRWGMGLEGWEID